MATRPDTAGVALERLVTLVETTLARDERYTIERRKRLRDKDTGKLREHDVVLTWTDRHHKIVTAIECRDRSRPVGVPEVEAFSAKCHRTGVDRGVIVSTNGFADSARVKANQAGVGCMEMSAAEAFDWCQMPGLIGRHKHIRHLDLFVGLREGPEASALVESKQSFTVFTPADVELTGQGWNAIVDANVPWDGLAAGQHQLGMVVTEPGHYVISDDGDRVEVENVKIDVVVEMTEVIHPLLFNSYSDGKITFGVVTTSFEALGKTIRIAMVRDTDDTTRVVAMVD